MLNLFQHLKI